MAQHMRRDEERGREANDLQAKRSSLLASAQSAQANASRRQSARTAGGGSDAGRDGHAGRDGYAGSDVGRASSTRDTGRATRAATRNPARERDAGAPRHAQNASQAPRASARPAQPGQPGRPAQRETLGQFIRRNIVYILSVIIVVAVFVVVLVVARGCVQNVHDTLTATGEPVATDEPSESSEYVSPYNWENLQMLDGRFVYLVDGQVKSKTGIDVSEHHGQIDWDAVAQDGVDFAIVRVGYRGATEGEIYLDEQYHANMEGAKSAGLERGVYFFSQAETEAEAVEEADFVLGQLDGEKLAYPIAFDSEQSVPGVEESRTSDESNEEMTAIAKAFCDRVENAGYRSMVYGNVYDMSRYHYDDMKSRTIWWAEYDVGHPTAQIDVAIWQYSSNGSVAGVPNGADMNVDLAAALK